jgi:hypothetical protein
MLLLILLIHHWKLAELAELAELADSIKLN